MAKWRHEVAPEPIDPILEARRQRCQEILASVRDRKRRLVGEGRDPRIFVRNHPPRK